MKDIIRDGKVIGADFDGTEDDETILQALADSQEVITYRSYTAARAANAIEFKHGEKSERLKELAKKIGYAPATLEQYGSVGRRLTWDDIDGRLPFALYRDAVHGISNDTLLKKVIAHTCDRADIDGVDRDAVKEKIRKVEKAWKSGAPDSEIDQIIQEQAEPKPREEFLESDEFALRYQFTEDDIENLAGEIAAQILKKMIAIKKKNHVDIIVGRATIKVDYKARKAD